MTEIVSSVTVPSAYAELAAQLAPLNTPEEITSMLHVPVNTLNDWRSKGKGPKFVKIGRSVYYRRDDVLDYLQSQVFSSTAEARSASNGGAR